MPAVGWDVSRTYSCYQWAFGFFCMWPFHTAAYSRKESRKGLTTRGMVPSLGITGTVDFHTGHFSPRWEKWLAQQHNYKAHVNIINKTCATWKQKEYELYQSNNSKNNCNL